MGEYLFGLNGTRLKKVSVVLTLVLIVLSVVAGIVSLAYFSGEGTLQQNAWIPVLCFAVSPFLSWIIGAVLYCLGDLLDRVHDIDDFLSD